MKRRLPIAARYYRLRASIRRKRRLLFPSPAEVRLIRLMGGKVLTLPLLKSTDTGFPLAFVVTLGRLFKSEGMVREVRVGKCFVDFGNDIARGIEVDGRAYHNNIVTQIERDEYFTRYGWRVLHIDATDLWRQPSRVQQQVLRFLS